MDSEDCSLCLAAGPLRRPSGLLEVESLSRRRSTLAICDKPVLDGTGNANKGLVDINVILGGALPEVNAELLCKLLSFLRGDDLFVKHVALVSNENLVDVHIGVLLNLGDPISDRFKGPSVGDIVDEENALGAAKVGRCDGPETLLPGCVPDLQLDASPVNINILNLEVNSNRCDERGGERVVRVTE